MGAGEIGLSFRASGIGVDSSVKAVHFVWGGLSALPPFPKSIRSLPQLQAIQRCSLTSA